jgi:hypothetical protein
MPIRVLRHAIVVAIVLLSPWPAESNELFDVRVEITDSSLILVPVHINGTGPYSFVLDTGATTTMLDARLANRLGMPASGSLQLISGGGNFTASSGQVDEFRIGALEVRDLPVSWTSIHAIRRHDNRIVGVLGQDVLSRITVTVDFGLRRLTFGIAPCRNGDVNIDFQRADGRPMIPAVVVAPDVSRDARLVIDSAANVMILFGEPPPATMQASLATHGAVAQGAFLRNVELKIDGIALRRDAVVMRATTDRIETGLLPASWFSSVCVDGPRQHASLTR